MDQFDLFLLYNKEIAEAKLKIIERFQKQGRTKSDKRTSNINIAQHVLRNAGKPLHVSEIIELAKKDYNVQLDRDSIVSAILKKVNAGQMFIRTAPNTFAVAKEAPGSARSAEFFQDSGLAFRGRPPLTGSSSRSWVLSSESTTAESAPLFVGLA
jgi:hypothetical protein